MKITACVCGIVLTLFAIASTACSSGANNATNAPNTNTTTNAAATVEPAGTPVSGAAQSQTGTPEALVADLYKQHDANKGPFFQTKDRALVDKYFTKPTADLIWKDATSSKGEVGALDGDPLYAAQDTQIKNFAVGKADIKGETATVAVSFTNYDQKQVVTYSLKLISGNWKIDDIRWPDGDSMVKVIKDNYATKPAASEGEFAGKYQVGDTTCTVRPVKMAYEIKWTKGTGVEMFFFKEGTTFESSSDKGQPNSFVFDDENYNSGTFHRADGRVLPVKRAK